MIQKRKNIDNKNSSIKHENKILGRIDQVFLQKLRVEFERVAIRCNKQIAKDKDFSDEIFFNRVLKINHAAYLKWDNIEDRFKNIAMKCKSEKNFWGYYRKMCRTALIDEIRSPNFENTKVTFSSEDFKIEIPYLIDEFQLDPSLKRMAKRLHNALLEKIEIFSLFYVERRTLADCEEILGLKKSSIFLRKKELEVLLSRIVNRYRSKYDHNDWVSIFSFVIHSVRSERSSQ